MSEPTSDEILAYLDALAERGDEQARATARRIRWLEKELDYWYDQANFPQD